MSKSTRFSPEALDAMGLEDDGNGTFRKKSDKKKDAGIIKTTGQIFSEPPLFADLPVRSVYVGAVDPALPESKAVITKHEKGKIEIVSSTIDGLPNPSSQDVLKMNSDNPEEIMQSLAEQGSMLYSPPTPVLFDPKPFNISAIRELGSGTKARKESMSHLHKFAVDRVSASKGIFIRGNVASSKNSKTMGFYYEGKGANKKRVPTLVDSPATKKYRKETSADYRKYKDRFLQMAEGKEFPLMVRLTFIRSTIGRFDFGNAQQVVADLMVDNGWMPDDSTEYFCPVFNPTVYYSKNLSGILIELL